MPTASTHRPADQTRRQALIADRELRGKALLSWGAVTPLGDGLYLVKSQADPDRDYLVDVWEHRCECEDMQRVGRRLLIDCKHLVAAGIVARRLEENPKC